MCVRDAYLILITIYILMYIMQNMIEIQKEHNIFKGVDREKSAVFKELTQSFRTYELRGQAKKKKKF